LQVHRARKDYQRDRPLRPWLYTIALNLRREHFRRRQRRPETAFDPVAHGEPSVAPQAPTATDRLVRRALAQLPDNQREVIVMHWYEELSFAEIADLVGATLSAVKVRAHRGYKRLKEILAEPQDAPDPRDPRDPQA
jgi:RNA polymerase sigma-70 factor (ECF subfamily)